jgi:hypothetical protein
MNPQDSQFFYVTPREYETSVQHGWAGVWVVGRLGYLSYVVLFYSINSTGLLIICRTVLLNKFDWVTYHMTYCFT